MLVGGGGRRHGNICIWWWWRWQWRRGHYGISGDGGHGHSGCSHYVQEFSCTCTLYIHTYCRSVGHPSGCCCCWVCFYQLLYICTSTNLARFIPVPRQDQIRTEFRGFFFFSQIRSHNHKNISFLFFFSSISKGFFAGFVRYISCLNSPSRLSNMKRGCIQLIAVPRFCYLSVIALRSVSSYSGIAETKKKKKIDEGQTRNHSPLVHAIRWRQVPHRLKHAFQYCLQNNLQPQDVLLHWTNIVSPESSRSSPLPTYIDTLRES